MNEAPEKRTGSSLLGFWRRLGPGLVTGAADDDPSGIGTHSQIGAQFGFGLSWTFLFSFPLMVVIQEVSAEIGSVTGLPDTGERYLSTPLFADIEVDMTDEELEISRSTPGFRFEPAV